MGARGPAPKPTVVKALQGNPGKRALNRNEPRPGAGKIPSAPRWLSDDAKRQWRPVAKALHGCGLLTDVDVLALGMLCEAFAQYLEARRLLMEPESTDEQVEPGGEDRGARMRLVVKSDKGNLYQNPAVSLMNSARVELLKWLREFGMTPSARSRISVETTGEEESLADLLFKAVER